jgi:hypothetical protein
VQGQYRSPATLDIDPRELTEDGQQTVQRTAGRESHVYHHNAPTPPRKRVNVSRNAKGLYTWEFTYESVGETDQEVIAALQSLNGELVRAFGAAGGPATSQEPSWES